jgi:DNA-binding HxlR family transcriptional regulator
VNSSDRRERATIRAMLIRRDVFTAHPPRGDYFLSPTGLAAPMTKGAS